MIGGTQKEQGSEVWREPSKYGSREKEEEREVDDVMTYQTEPFLQEDIRYEVDVRKQGKEQREGEESPVECVPERERHAYVKEFSRTDIVEHHMSPRPEGAWLSNERHGMIPPQGGKVNGRVRLPHPREKILFVPCAC